MVTHRPVTANGTRFHIAEAGEGPLVLLLHGFPQFWWTWRAQLTSLPAPAGYRAVAADLRGYGGSDKPPRGYDLITAASDAACMVRALGEANAVVVGHDWGGLVAWTMATYFPRWSGASPSFPWPTRCGCGPPCSPTRSTGPAAGRRSASSCRCCRNGGWSGTRPGGSAGCCTTGPGRDGRTGGGAPLPGRHVHPLGRALGLEYHRWFVRSRLRSDGMRYAHRMRAPVQAPTLQLHGALDSCVPAPPRVAAAATFTRRTGGG